MALNKYFYNEHIDGVKSIVINSDYIEECMQYYYDNNIDFIIISALFGYQRSDIDFLSDYPDISGLSLSCEGITDVKGVYTLTQLKMLLVMEIQSPIDLTRFPSVERLTVYWNKYITLPDQAPNLKILTCQGYRPKSKDLSQFKHYHILEKLIMTSSNIVSLSGIENLSQLDDIELRNMSRLEDIQALTTIKSLEGVEFEIVKKVKNFHEILPLMKNLQYFSLVSCSDIPSLAFIKTLPKLNRIFVYKTNIMDGDMTPCFDLDAAVIDNRKHYSHTKEEVEKIIDLRKQGVVDAHRQVQKTPGANIDIIKMPTKSFWKLISVTNQTDAPHEKSFLLTKVLEKLEVSKLHQFINTYSDYMIKANTWSLWGAAYVIAGGCSEDSFIEFRNWLISQGETILLKAIKRPDDLDELTDIPFDDDQPMPFISDLDLVAIRLYEEKTKTEIDIDLRINSAPEDDDAWGEAEEDLKPRFPKLWKKYASVSQA